MSLRVPLKRNRVYQAVYSSSAIVCSSLESLYVSILEGEIPFSQSDLAC